MANKILFKRGLLSALPVPANRDADTLYFVTDKGELYLGAQRFSDVILATAEPTLDTVLANQIHIFGNKLYFRGTKTVDGVTSDAVITVDVGNIAETLAGLRTDVDAKVASVSAGDNSVTIGGTDTAPTVAAKISGKSGNTLALVSNDGEEGLYVPAPAAADEYSIAKDDNSGDYAAVYHLTKNGTNTGVAINIPKDMVVQSGSVVTDPDGQPEGTYIKLVLQNVTDPLYINVGSLIEYVTSGSAAGDMVVVTVSDDHKVTATITDGTITLAKLASAVQTEIGKAHEHSNKALLDTYTQSETDLADAVNKKHEHATGSKDIVTVSGDLSYSDGTLSYSHPTTTAVGAAFVKVGKDDKGHVVVGDTVAKSDLTGLLDAGDGTYDAKGSAAAVLGTSGDAASDDTVYGAKAYADAAVETAMTWGSF